VQFIFTIQLAIGLLIYLFSLKKKFFSYTSWDRSCTKKWIHKSNPTGNIYAYIFFFLKKIISVIYREIGAKPKSEYINPIATIRFEPPPPWGRTSWTTKLSWLSRSPEMHMLIYVTLLTSKPSKISWEETRIDRSSWSWDGRGCAQNHTQWLVKLIGEYPWNWKENL